MVVSVNGVKHNQTQVNVLVLSAMQCNQRLQQVIQNDLGLFHSKMKYWRLTAIAPNTLASKFFRC